MSSKSYLQLLIINHPRFRADRTQKSGTAESSSTLVATLFFTYPYFNQGLYCYNFNDPPHITTYLQAHIVIAQELICKRAAILSTHSRQLGVGQGNFKDSNLLSVPAFLALHRSFRLSVA
jgi:hypothetical protein